MIRLALLVLLVLGLPVLKAQEPSLCGKYSTIFTATGPTCHRVGVLPWLLGIPGVWETELRFGASGDTVRLKLVSSLSEVDSDANLLLEDSDGLKMLELFDGLPVRAHGSYWTRIIGACHVRAGQCPPESLAASMVVSVDAPNAAALESASASAVYRYTPNGVVASETAAPFIFLDQAAARWSAIITETPRDLQSEPDSTITSFAVANLSPDPQAVLIRIYNEFGALSASSQTPVLGQALGFSGSTEVLVGGVYAATLSSVLGIDLPASPCTGCASPTVFRGTVVFEGEKGGPIAPVVFRFNGSALTTVPVKAE